MKIGRNEFKALLKECLQELIQDGALNHMFQTPSMPQGQVMQQNPMVSLAARQVGKNPHEVQMMETLFADTAANAMQIQASAPDPIGMMSNMGYGNQGFYPQQQYANGPQYVNVPPIQQIGTMPQQPQQQSPGVGSNWARLAFNSPIRNRPGGQEGGAGHLPGQNMGRFG